MVEAMLMVFGESEIRIVLLPRAREMEGIEEKSRVSAGNES
jgi:hypothetical protein